MQSLAKPSLTPEQVEQFFKDGFLEVENVVPAEIVDKVMEQFDPLYAGEL